MKHSTCNDNLGSLCYTFFDKRQFTSLAFAFNIPNAHSTSLLRQTNACYIEFHLDLLFSQGKVSEALSPTNTVGLDFMTANSIANWCHKNVPPFCSVINQQVSKDLSIMQTTGKAIGDIHKYFSSVNDDLDYHITLLISAKADDSTFFWHLYFDMRLIDGTYYFLRWFYF